MIQTDPRYASPEIPGLVKYSNYGKFERKTGIEFTKEFIIKDIASEFGIPEADVWVISFNPTNTRSKYGIYWAAYVTIEHKDLIDKFKAELTMLMEMFKEISDDSSFDSHNYPVDPRD